MESRLARLAQRQHGLLTRQQLIARGCSDGAIRHMRAARRLERIRPGVYRVVGSPPSWHQSLLAVLLCVDGATASHTSAARLLGVDLRSDAHELTTDRLRRVCLPGVHAHRSVLWLPEDSARRDGILTSSPARLIVDLSGRLDVRSLGKILDGFLRRRLMRLPDLARTNGRLAAARGRRPSLVHDLLQARTVGYSAGDSDLEARIIRSLLRAGLPPPTAQHHIRLGSRRYRVDLAYPDQSLAIEIDSWAYHQWRSSFDGDRARRNDLTLAGYTVLQVTDGMTDDEIVDLVTRARAALGAHAAS